MQNSSCNTGIGNFSFLFSSVDFFVARPSLGVMDSVVTAQAAVGCVLALASLFPPLD